MKVQKFEGSYLEYVKALQLISDKGFGNDTVQIQGFEKLYANAVAELSNILPSNISDISRWLSSEILAFCNNSADIEIIDFSDDFLKTYKSSIYKFELIDDLLGKANINSLDLQHSLNVVLNNQDNNTLEPGYLYAFIPFLFYIDEKDHLSAIIKKAFLVYNRNQPGNHTIVQNLLALVNSLPDADKQNFYSWLLNNIDDGYTRDQVTLVNSSRSFRP